MPKTHQNPITLIRREDRYISFPALACLDNGELLMAFRSGRNCYRDFPEALNLGYQHPHTDPFSEPWLARSRDDGRTWQIEDPPRARKLLDEDHARGIAYQDVGFTKLTDGRVMLSAFVWKYSDELPPDSVSTSVREESPSLHGSPRREDTYDYRRFQPYRYAYLLRPMYSVSDPIGRNWSAFKPIDVPEPGSGKQWGLATRNGGVLLDDDTVGWPFYCGLDPVHPDRGGCHLLKYHIGADRWSYGAQIAAGSEQFLMEEPLVHRHPAGHLIGFYRTTSPGDMFANISHDNGKTWTEPVRTRVWGHPFAALTVDDRDVLLAYGYRREPLGIRMCRLAGGDVNAFDPSAENVVRDDALTDDIGYPALCHAKDGSIVLAYYYWGKHDTGHPARYIAVQRFMRDDV